MRLIEQLSNLPPDQGRLSTDNTDVEHALTLDDERHQYNHLRRAELIPRSEVGDMDDISSKDFATTLQGSMQEITFVYQQDMPGNITRLAAAAVGQREETGEFSSRMDVKEIVVHPELRDRHIASFLLEKITQKSHPTEMVVETNVFRTDDWFIDKLTEAGFRHESPNGSPAIWLPGRQAIIPGHFDDPDFVKRQIGIMPPDWYGAWKFFPQTDPQLQVFRHRKLTGIVRPIEGSETRDKHDNKIGDFKVSDAGGADLGIVRAATQTQAMIALLNDYDLITAA